MYKCNTCYHCKMTNGKCNIDNDQNNNSCKDYIKSSVTSEFSFEEGYDKAIDDIIHIIDEADDNANAMYLLGQFIIERKMKQ